jgi:hypothetical protein
MLLNILYTAVVVELDDVDVVVNDGMPVMRQVHAELTRLGWLPQFPM